MCQKSRAQSAQRDSRAQFQAAASRACRESLETCPASLLFWLRLRSLCGFLAIDIFVLDVALRISVDRSLIDSRQYALHFARRAHDQTARGNHGAFRNERARGDDAARANRRTVQNDRAHADQAARLDHAAMQRHRMPDGHAIAENERTLVAHDVQYAAVLNVGARADADVVHVAANHRARPNARILANHHVANDDRGGINVRRSRDLRVLSAIWPDVGLAPQSYPLLFLFGPVPARRRGQRYLIVRARYTCPAPSGRAPTKELACMNHVKITSGSPY